MNTLENYEYLFILKLKRQKTPEIIKEFIKNINHQFKDDYVINIFKLVEGKECKNKIK